MMQTCIGLLRASQFTLAFGFGPCNFMYNQVCDIVKQHAKIRIILSSLFSLSPEIIHSKYKNALGNVQNLKKTSLMNEHSKRL